MTAAATLPAGFTSQTLPTDDGTNPFYSETTTLDGVAFILTFAYNQREGCWYLSVATLEGADIANGLKLVCSWDLLGWCADTRKPPGKLLVISATTDLSPPGLADLGPAGRCRLVYVPVASVAAVGAAG